MDGWMDSDGAKMGKLKSRVGKCDVFTVGKVQRFMKCRKEGVKNVSRSSHRPAAKSVSHFCRRDVWISIMTHKQNHQHVVNI